ncbi:hypothetical protein GSI_02014 [Ganoderma sinense ZZ0214-1]|uniref:Uncharacterized protein n=1 Tax=Ganoderma sinense ZZ0214-1 TaxID=1077348 RepID=A0A2G8SNH0_9APHY|nr:hypothetical protein GSI_02014 [Ganoderma sinense ZZ0214-1]
MSSNRYLVPHVPVYPGEVSFTYRDTQTQEILHPFSLWELHQLKQHQLPDYRTPVSPTPRPGAREQLTLLGPDGRVLDLGRYRNETAYPTDNKGRLGKAIGTEYYYYYTVKLGWEPLKAELFLRNAFLVKTWHTDRYGWNVEVKFRDINSSVLNQRPF